MKKTVKNLVIGSTIIGLGVYVYRILKVDKHYKTNNIQNYDNGNKKYIDLTEIYEKEKRLQKEIKKVDEEAKDLAI